MSQNQFSPKIRIEHIELQNFKGVSNGIIDFNCLKTPVEKETCSDILGLYGQNGSGKTTLLEALHVAKLAMMGQKVPFAKYGNMIAQGADSARMSITFQISNPDGSFYHVEYAFSLGIRSLQVNETQSTSTSNILKAATGLGGAALAASSMGSVAAASTTIGVLANPVLMPAMAVVGAAGVVANHMMKASSTGKEGSNSDSTIKVFAIFDEVLNLSGTFNGTVTRLGPIWDARATETAFLPRVRQKSFFPNKTATALKELQKYKERAMINSQSFIFGDDVSQLLFEQGIITEYAQIILDLKAFAIQKIRILDSKTIGTSDEGAIPLYTANRGIKIKRSDATAFLDEEGLQTLQVAIKGLNVVLQQLIPGLSLEAVRQVDVDLDNDRNARMHVSGTKVTVYSVRNNIRIPLTEESTGIIRLISSIGLISYAFANPDVTVAIDEIDAGVYEYLLGELLLIFEEYGNGQLIFTCHNLRPLEVLDKKYIYFTTTNPDNRYLKPKNIRNENNLRDVYLKEIINGGQEEDLYSVTKHGKIASALQKAGEIIGQE